MQSVPTTDNEAPARRSVLCPQPERRPAVAHCPPRSGHTVRRAGTPPQGRQWSPVGRAGSPPADSPPIDLRSAPPEALLRYDGYAPRYPSPDGLARSAGRTEHKPILGLRCILPCPLRSEDGVCDRVVPAGPPSPLVTAAFERAFERLLREELHVQGATIIEWDEWVHGLRIEALWRIGCLLARNSPVRVPGFTRYHRFAMCVADALEARGVRVK